MKVSQYQCIFQFSFQQLTASFPSIPPAHMNPGWSLKFFPSLVVLSAAWHVGLSTMGTSTFLCIAWFVPDCWVRLDLMIIQLFFSLFNFTSKSLLPQPDMKHVILWLICLSGRHAVVIDGYGPRGMSESTRRIAISWWSLFIVKFGWYMTLTTSNSMYWRGSALDVESHSPSRTLYVWFLSIRWMIYTSRRTNWWIHTFHRNCVQQSVNVADQLSQQIQRKNFAWWKQLLAMETRQSWNDHPQFLSQAKVDMTCHTDNLLLDSNHLSSH